MSTNKDTTTTPDEVLQKLQRLSDAGRLISHSDPDGDVPGRYLCGDGESTGYYLWRGLVLRVCDYDWRCSGIWNDRINGLGWRAPAGVASVAVLALDARVLAELATIPTGCTYEAAAQRVVDTLDWAHAVEDDIAFYDDQRDDGDQDDEQNGDHDGSENDDETEVAK